MTSPTPDSWSGAEFHGGSQPDRAQRGKPRRRISVATVTTLILSALILAALVTFLLQNSQHAGIRFLGWSASMSQGLALTLAAAAGAFVVAIPLGIHMLRTRRRRR